MRTLEVIEKDLAAAREALLSVEGRNAEVYSRIVGYYRSVRNWNKGKREEYGERRLYRVKDEGLSAAAVSPSPSRENDAEPALTPPLQGGSLVPAVEVRLLLFVRAACPNCSPAKAAAVRLGIPMDLVNADTTDGMAEAVRRNVLSTPTAILLSLRGEELGRAGNVETIGRMLDAKNSAAKNKLC